MITRVFSLIAALSFAVPLAGAARDETPARNLILITLDGVRWQDVFRGPDPLLVENSHYTNEDLKESVKAAWFDVPDRGAALMPFLHSMKNNGGVLYGNADQGECMRVSNDMWFSYPGYNEILTGRPDNRITSNDKIYNPNVTFLEWLNRRPQYRNQVVAMGTWDVFPYIVNDKRSGVPVNTSFNGRYPTDTLTARAALDTLRTARPRVMYIGFGDTDELAHTGDYDQYLASLNRVDDFIGEVWRLVEANPFYRGRTTIIVTTDHGRGESSDETWREHSSKTYLQLYPDYLRDYTNTGITGSDEIWFAAFGAGVNPTATSSQTCASQSQIAASALTALGLDWRMFDKSAGAPLPQFR